ncbi:MAG TPA: ankyrin repeat domain-containing protein [Kofleriaceae bacterium]|nr:ankyrin repeat domain-containing protein [Kofleriaceae bacterium]
MSGWQHAALPVRAPLEAYQAHAAQLLEAFRRGDPAARDFVHRHLPRFLDPVVTWKPRELAEGELEQAVLDEADARLAIARGYSFRDWDALAALVAAVQTPGSPVRAFELAAEAVIDGDVDGLRAMLAAEPSLARARSTRVCCFDPPVHRATLLHYLAANGVEGHRQRSPRNAVDVARLLLDAGAEPDALASMYGGAYATMSLLVSSSHPAEAGVQIPLVDALLAAGASVDGAGDRTWGCNLRTALAFGFVDAAQALVARGARVDRVDLAAGLGRTDDVRRLLPASSADDRHAALSLAAQLGHAETVRVLLDAGEDPDRYNPASLHPHSTPLHQAAVGGHLDVVRALVLHGARLDPRDRLWNGTPLGWARHGEQADVVAYLVSVGAP